MAQRSSVARVYSVMQELQQLREKVAALSEKNRHLAKALTAAKQEATKARMTQNAAFSDKVAEWMDARYNPVEVQHQATQCSMEEPTKSMCASVKDMSFEPDAPLSPERSGEDVQTLFSDQHVSSPCKANFMNGGAFNSAMCDKITNTMNVQEDLKSDDDEEDTVSHEIAKTRIFEASVESLASVPNRSFEYAEPDSLQSSSSSHFDVEAGRSSSQSDATKCLRQRSTEISYVEPKLNTKLRRGDYYGLGKRTGQQRHHHRPPKQRVISEPPRATPGLFGRRRTMRHVQHVSYAEPKLNTKLRQGDKFTFTT